MQPIDENTPGAVEVTTWHLEITDPTLVPEPTPSQLGAEVVVEDVAVDPVPWLADIVVQPTRKRHRHPLGDDDLGVESKGRGRRN